MSALAIYFIAILDNFHWVIGCFQILAIICMWPLCFFLYTNMEEGEDEKVKGYEKKVRTLVVSFIVVSVLASFLPNTKQAAAIYIIPAIANNQQFQQIPAKLLELGNSWLDELKPAPKETVTPTK